jgi:hypothetical protein
LRIPAPTTSNLRAIRAFNDGRAVVLGDFGTVFLLEGGDWRAVHDGRAIVWNDIACFSATDAWFAGRTGTSDGIVRHIDGRAWTFPGEEALALFGFAPDNVYLSGRAGTIRHFDGSNWTNENSGTLETLAGIGGVMDDDGRHLFAVGDRGTIRTWTGTRWGPMLPPGNSIQPLVAVWAAAADDVFAVGATSSVFRYRGPPGSLQWSAEPTTLSGSSFAAIAGRSPTEVVAVSHDGRFFHYNGTAWRQVVGGNGAALTDVVLEGRRDGFALGSPHTLFSLQGGGWNSHDVPHLGDLRSIAAAGNVGFVAGRYGAILEFTR